MEERVPVTDKHSRWNGKLALENGFLSRKSQPFLKKECLNGRKKVVKCKISFKHHIKEEKKKERCGETRDLSTIIMT